MSVEIIEGDCRDVLRGMDPDSVHCVVTSPPYWGLRDYGVEPGIWGGDPDCQHDWGEMLPGSHPGQVEQTKWKTANAAGVGQNASSGQFCKHCTAWLGNLGLEPSLDLHVEHIVQIFREVRRVLRKDGVLWLNYGDCYATSANGRSAADTKATGNDDRTFRDKPFSTVSDGLKAKDLCMVPARVALALQADGWWLRSMLPWVKRNPMPESIKDRPSVAVEYVFLLTKSARYYYDAEAVMRNVAPSSEARLRQNVAAQKGSMRANGGAKTNGPMKARASNKQRGHARPHAGFNDRWDTMSREEQTNSAAMRNTRLFFESLGPFGLMSSDDGPLALDVATHPFSEAHFATFPPRLVAPLIKAGTSERGVCPSCGAPWVRMIERESRKNMFKAGQKHDGTYYRPNPGGGVANDRREKHEVGWSPSCDCDSGELVPATVLDPFGGSGTVGLVAKGLRRNAVLIELNPEYAEMARQRVNTTPLFDFVERSEQLGLDVA